MTNEMTAAQAAEILSVIRNRNYEGCPKNNAQVLALDLALRSLSSPPAVPVPSRCDGKEQDAFEDWARHQRYDMATHPLHWLFLDSRTYAARDGWAAALEYVTKQTAAASPSEPPSGEVFCDANCVWTDHHPDCPIPSPAEQGAREDVHSGCGHTHAEHANERQGCINAPLAAGRVGVTELRDEIIDSLVGTAGIIGKDRPGVAQILRTNAERVAKLAGPVVAGEVEAEHTTTPDCWCNPTPHEIGPSHWIWEHHDRSERS